MIYPIVQGEADSVNGRSLVLVQVAGPPTDETGTQSRPGCPLSHGCLNLSDKKPSSNCDHHAQMDFVAISRSCSESKLIAAMGKSGSASGL